MFCIGFQVCRKLVFYSVVSHFKSAAFGGKFSEIF